MDYIKIKFGNEIHHFESGLGKTIDDMFRSINPMFPISERTWKPQMDIFETPEEIIVIAEMAGVNKEDLELEISSKAVKIFGLRGEMPRFGNATYMLAEIQYGKFERTLYLRPSSTRQGNRRYQGRISQNCLNQDEIRWSAQDTRGRMKRESVD